MGLLIYGMALLIQDFGVICDDKLRTSEHWFTEILSNHLSKEKKRGNSEESFKKDRKP